MLPVFLTVVLCMSLTMAYPSGPPVSISSVCQDMNPQMGHGVGHTDQDPYFELVTSATCYENTPQLNVELRVENSVVGTPDKYFQGAFIQARKPGNNLMSYGTFTSTTNNFSPLSCFGTNDNALGHSATDEYHYLPFIWTPPAGFTDDIEFVATVVHDRATYWLNIKSDIMTYACPSSTPSSTTVSTPTPSECEWTEWFDRDNPSGTGDWETLAGHKKAGLVPMAAKPEDVECASLDESGYAEDYSCTLDGLVCKNDEQVNCFCQDYKVRYCINAGDEVDCNELKNKKEKKKCKKAAKSASADPCEGLKKKKKKACEKEQEPCFYLKKKQLKKCEKEEAVGEWVDPCKGKKGKAKKKCQKSACQPMDL